MKIDFREIGGQVFTGRPRGIALRERFKLERADSRLELVEVIIPEDVYSVTSSFFLGMFDKSILTYGSKDKFREHYSFKVPDRINNRIDEWIGRALREKQGIFGRD